MRTTKPTAQWCSLRHTRKRERLPIAGAVFVCASPYLLYGTHSPVAEYLAK